MEHSALHALLLIGLIVSLGGPFAAALMRTSGAPPAMLASLGRTTALGALLAALATFVDLAVQVAEVDGRTVFGGVDFRLLVRFATNTTVGQLSLARAGVLVVTATLAWQPRSWILIALSAFGTVVFTALVSHAAAQPSQRGIAIATQILHIAASAAWMGVVLHLFLLRESFAQAPEVIAKVVRRFSPIALGATATILLTGLLAVLRSLHSPASIFGSAYGWTLLVKLTLIIPAVYAGWLNFRYLSRALAHTPAALPQFRRTLELETLAGVLVLTVAGILGSISPPGDDGSLCLTSTQFRALLSPDFPTSHVDDWTAPDNPLAPTDDELRYSELTHNWSGILVIVLGTLWLAQARGGRVRDWAGRMCAVALVPFGLFIAAVANPEVWLLRRVSIGEVFGNPILLEHQLGALLVFVLAWLAWRDGWRPEHLRPLGYALPAVMILGSLLLLGHAHAMVSVPDALSNLINVEHAIMGACGLFGGTLRLMQLRALIPSRAAAIGWPSCVIALGIFMAFFYRELVP